MKPAFFIISITQLILQLLIINYLYQLEKKGCKCAMDFKRVYILIFAITNFIYIILNTFTNFFVNIRKNNVGSSLLGLYGIGGIVNIVFIIEYVNLLKKRNCECSESVYRDMMYVFAIIDAIIMGMSLLLVLFIIFLFKFNNKSIKVKRKVKK